MNFLRLNIFDFNKRMNEWIHVYQKEHEYIHWYWYLYIFIWTLFLLFTQIQTETEQQESANNFVIYLYVCVCVCLFIATGHGWVPCWRRCGCPRNHHCWPIYYGCVSESQIIRYAANWISIWKRLDTKIPMRDATILCKTVCILSCVGG